MTFGYDPVGNMTSLCDGAGTFTYSYDAANRMTGLALPGGSCTPTVSQCVSYGYDHDNRVNAITWPTSTTVSESIGYNNSGEETTLSATAGSTTLVGLTYSYEQGTSTDRPLAQSVANSVSGVTTSYTYNALERLTSATDTGADTHSYSYTYDADGNMTSQVVPSGTTSMAYNEADELCWAYAGTSSNSCGSPPSGATTFTYDGDGEQTASSAGIANDYNPLGQATSMTTGCGGCAESFTYTGPTEAQRTAAGSSTFANTALGPDLVNIDGSAITLSHTPSGALVGSTSSAGQGYYLTDAQGSVIAEVNGSGSEVASYSYDPYGNVLSSSGSGAATNHFRFQGGYQDSSGYDHFGDRYYNPALGSWSQQDPVPGTIADPSAGDRYPFVADDPVNEEDPSGACVLGLFGSHCHNIVHSVLSATSCVVSQFNPFNTSAGALLVEEGSAGAGTGVFIATASAATGPAGAVVGGIYGGLTALAGVATVGIGVAQIAKGC